MRYYIYFLWACLVGIVLLAVSPAFFPYSPPLKSPHVKVTYLEAYGHGSATHIGNGYYLTAAHVIQDGLTPVLTGGHTASVLWVNKEYDIALLRAETPFVASVDIDCRTPKVGEHVSLHGNPLDLDNITTWGRVAGTQRQLGQFTNVIPLDAVVMAGMSGGALLDKDGELIGVNVAVMTWRMGAVGISYSVPASSICMLMTNNIN